MAIRRLCQIRLKQEAPITGEEHSEDPTYREFLDSLHDGPIAPVPEAANRQHYELPPEFFEAVLGPRQKYSCCFYPREDATLAEAETAALAITCERADLADGQEILELGCGWGSLSLWMAERYPGSRITAVSNSVPQRRYIDARATKRGLDNLRVISADMNDFSPGTLNFDRIVSVEMFEHMRNYERLLHNIAGWLRPGGKLFVHIFCHRNMAYPFETEGATNWMGRHFFTGGVMPSANLLHQFPRDLAVAEQHSWNGTHYRRTADDWLANLDARRDEVIDILSRVYGESDARRWLYRWRVFFLAVSELFGFNHGEEWFVSHYVLQHAH
ncbi:SAM-dependent methyltransferase [Singulisphaera sp. PoT]|uniref:SAM-dependent methyltransferase n=1 Tax=Singulisphaera sp. PoT TaxID=3411797 RepID=UPI003BF54A97